MNGKKIAINILDCHLSRFLNVDELSYTSLEEMKALPEYEATIRAMIEFAKLACEEQKKICLEESKLKTYNEDRSGKEINIQLWGYPIESKIGYVEIDEKSILNAPTVNFEEDSK